MILNNSSTGEKGCKPSKDQGLVVDGKVASASKQKKKTTTQLVARPKSMQIMRAYRLGDGPIGNQAR